VFETTAQIEPIFDNFSNPVNYLTWPDHGSHGQWQVFLFQQVFICDGCGNLFPR
jgi:hypothetical protein